MTAGAQSTGQSAVPPSEMSATSGLALSSGNYCRSPAMLTSTQSQGTKMASTVARDSKIDENQNAIF